MAGPRLPLEVIEGRGAKHLSEKERQQRKAGEIRNNEQIKRLLAPAWLPDGQKKEFNRIASALIKLMPTMVTRLDAEEIANYCIYRAQWLVATTALSSALKSKNLDDAEKWGKVQQRFFQQARACANAMGMTITSRCRLVLPESSQPKEPNAFEEMLRRKMQG